MRRRVAFLEDVAVDRGGVTSRDVRVADGVGDECERVQCEAEDVRGVGIRLSDLNRGHEKLVGDQ